MTDTVGPVAGRPCGLLIVGALLLLPCFASCSKPPQIAPQHRELLDPLQTAISARNDEWLNTAVKEVRKRRDSGAMSDEEFAAFDAVIQAAENGKWEKAQSLVADILEAQTPTTEDLENLQGRKVPKFETDDRHKHK